MSRGLDPRTSYTKGRSKRVSILFSPTEYMYQRLSAPVLIDEPKWPYISETKIEVINK